MHFDVSDSLDGRSGMGGFAVVPDRGALAQPHSVEAEQYLLSSILADDTPAAWAVAVQAGIKRAAFFVPAHQRVWTALNDLRKAGKSGTCEAVALDLQARNQLDAVGGMEGLIELSGKLPTSMRVRELSEHVKLLWDLRHAEKLTTEFAEQFREPVERATFVEKSMELGTKLIRLGRREAALTVAQHAASVRQRVEARANGTEDQSRWVCSSLKPFNDYCKPYNSGLQDDGLVLVAGASGTGKSVFLRQEAGSTLDAGKVVLSFSRETGTTGFIAMLAASRVGVDLDNLDRELKDRLQKYYAEIERMEREWADKTLFCVQQEPATPLVTIEDLVDQVHQFVNLRGVPNLIIVDYLQLFGTRKRLGSREQEVAHVSHALQALRLELGCVIMVAAQMNSAAIAAMKQENRDSKGKLIHRLPNEGDLRESRAMYHDADRVLFLYRPPFDCRDQDQRMPAVLKPEVWIYQEKRRSGGVRYVKTWFERRYTRFVAFGSGEGETATASPASPYTPPDENYRGTPAGGRARGAGRRDDAKPF